jgi:hypothetical protein
MLSMADYGSQPNIRHINMALRLVVETWQI